MHAATRDSLLLCGCRHDVRALRRASQGTPKELERRSAPGSAQHGRAHPARLMQLPSCYESAFGLAARPATCSTHPGTRVLIHQVKEHSPKSLVELVRCSSDLPSVIGLARALARRTPPPRHPARARRRLSATEKRRARRRAEARPGARGESPELLEPDSRRREAAPCRNGGATAGVGGPPRAAPCLK